MPLPTPESEPQPFWLLPNILSLIRLAGSLVLLGLAFAQQPWWFAGLYLFLAFTDLIDGPIARWFNQRSEIGAGLDSAADVTLSSCLLLGAMILRWDMFRPELPWVVAAISSYLIAIAAGFRKFGGLPSYHTWSAKVTHVLVVLAGLALVLGWSTWPLRIAAMAAMLANLESVWITISLRHARSNVASIFAVSSVESGEADVP